MTVRRFFCPGTSSDPCLCSDCNFNGFWILYTVLVLIMGIITAIYAILRCIGCLSCMTKCCPETAARIFYIEAGAYGTMFIFVLGAVASWGFLCYDSTASNANFLFGDGNYSMQFEQAMEMMIGCLPLLLISACFMGCVLRCCPSLSTPCPRTATEEEYIQM